MSNEITNSSSYITQILKYGLFALVGIVIIIGVLVSANNIRNFMKNSFSAKGTVVALNAGGSHPKIKFTTQEDKEIEYSQNGLIFGYQVGDEVMILYNPQNPQDASINTFGALWGFHLLGFILGICFIGAACFKYVYSQ
jgi:Protein of unknown function (DUF3592)